MPYQTKVFLEAEKYFDLTDRTTRKALIACNETDQNKVLVALTSKLYDKIIENVDQIDFGDIPKSRGDITKLPNYKKVIECIDIIENILKTTNQPLDTINVLKDAISNVTNYKDTFIKAFQNKTEFAMLVYNETVLGVYSGLSVLISSCIEFIKDPNDNGFQFAVDKVALSKTKDSLLFQDLKKLNKVYSNGTLDHAIQTVSSMQIKHEAIGPVVTISAAMGLILNIIPILRELTYFFFATRTKVADYFDAQAAILQMNAYNVVNNNAKSEAEKKQIKRRQLDIAKKFQKIADFIRVKTSKAEQVAIKDSKNLEKKLKINDVVDELPDGASDSLF